MSPSTSDASLIDMVGKPCADTNEFTLPAKARTSIMYDSPLKAMLNNAAKTVAKAILFIATSGSKTSIRSACFNSQY
jgi:hypothetical protein